jgi:hypothetical protein
MRVVIFPKQLAGEMVFVTKGRGKGRVTVAKLLMFYMWITCEIVCRQLGVENAYTDYFELHLT